MNNFPIGTEVSLTKKECHDIIHEMGLSDENFLYFIETGTYCGCTLWEMKDLFKTCISIELSNLYYNYSKEKFKNYNNVIIYEGDSGVLLNDIFDSHQIKENAIIFLDGHFSGEMTAKGEEDTPLIKEITHIINKNIKNSIIIIDDYNLYPICYSGEIEKMLSGRIRSKITKGIRKMCFLI